MSSYALPIVAVIPTEVFDQALTNATRGRPFTETQKAQWRLVQRNSSQTW